MKQRIKYIDHLKGISILLVVIGHIIQYNVADSKDNGLFNFIYSFHMPLFMFISGYVSVLTIKINIFPTYFDFLLKKMRTLLLPFFTWALLVDSVFFNNPLKFDFYGRFAELFYDPRTGLWFLWYLFFLTVLYSAFLFISSRWNLKSSFLIDVLIFTALLALLVLLRVLKITIYVDSFIQYYLYFFIGVFVAKYLWLKQLILNVRYFSFFLISFLILVGHFSFNDPGLHSLGTALLLKISVAISGIFVLYYIVYNAVWTSILDDFITHWGMSSLAIYATHFKFLEVLKGFPLMPSLSMTLLIPISLMVSIIIIVICMKIYEIVKLSPVLNLLLYGAKIK